jgi:hypothetical protein
MQEFEWSKWFYIDEDQLGCPEVLEGKVNGEVQVIRYDGGECPLDYVNEWRQYGDPANIEKYRYKLYKTQTGYAGADELGEIGIALTDTEISQDSPWSGQVGGSHYTDLKIQPLYRTLVNKGYEAFSGACYTKIDKYTTRTKDSEVEQLKKARHVLDLWIYEAEQKEMR